MHVVTHLSPKYEAMRNSENGWSIQEAGMAQLDDIVGATMQKLKDMGVDDNTIVVFTTDNGTETFTWPDGGSTPFKGQKGTIYEGGFRVPAMVRWPGHVPPDSVAERHHLRPRLVADFRRRSGQSEHLGRIAEGQRQIGDRTYKNHLDGYNQMDLITGKGPSARHEIFYFGESTLGAVRIDDFKYRFIEQPDGWLGGKVHVDAPTLINLRLDPVRAPGMAGERHARRRAGATSTGSSISSGASCSSSRKWGSSPRPAIEYPADAERRELQPGGRESADRGSHKAARRAVTGRSVALVR